MSFSDERARASAHVLARLGVPATYAPKSGGSPVNTRVLIKSSMEESGESGTIAAQVNDVRIPLADVPVPERGATLTLADQSRLRLVSATGRDSVFTVWRVANV